MDGECVGGRLRCPLSSKLETRALRKRSLALRHVDEALDARSVGMLACSPSFLPSGNLVLDGSLSSSLRICGSRGLRPYAAQLTISSYSVSVAAMVAPCALAPASVKPARCGSPVPQGPQHRDAVEAPLVEPATDERRLIT